jgi:hypothetical protein
VVAAGAKLPATQQNGSKGNSPAAMAEALDWLKDLLYESRQKWKEIRDWKRFLSIFQLGLAEFFRWLTLLLFMFSMILTGLPLSLLSLNIKYV